MNTVNVFVYGTLKLGGYFADLYKDVLDPLRVGVTEATVQCSLYQSIYGWPFAVIDDYSTMKGEIHEFIEPEKALEIFDLIEGYDVERDSGLFSRRIIKAETTDGNKIDVLMYLYVNKFDSIIYKKIENGIWEV